MADLSFNDSLAIKFNGTFTPKIDSSLDSDLHTNLQAAIRHSSSLLLRIFLQLNTVWVLSVETKLERRQSHGQGAISIHRSTESDFLHMVWSGKWMWKCRFRLNIPSWSSQEQEIHSPWDLRVHLVWLHKYSSTSSARYNLL